jgi:hypothetical protein
MLPATPAGQRIFRKVGTYPPSYTKMDHPYENKKPFPVWTPFALFLMQFAAVDKSAGKYREAATSVIVSGAKS